MLSMSMQGEAAQSMSKLAFQVNDTSQHLSKAMPSVTCMSVSTSVPVQAPAPADFRPNSGKRCAYLQAYSKAFDSMS